jgi:2-polyprenyl-3-methyl-5-hydroxy-6-metoxy-1,4-benzoquinol methylase
MDTKSFRNSKLKWNKEKQFFDNEAEKCSDSLPGIISSNVVARYKTNPGKLYNFEFCLNVLGDLSGKRILDVGCGVGSDAILFAKCGASVVGVDISEKSIEVARSRANANNVNELVEFICSPLEKLTFSTEEFDFIWGNGILHHLIGDIEAIMKTVNTFAKRDATIIFTEPINLSKTLRKLRMLVPVDAVGTEDERPLEIQEINLILKHLLNYNIRYFRFLTRLQRIILPSGNLEDASLPRKAMMNFLSFVDALALQIPLVQKFAGRAVIYGSPKPNL